MRFWLEHASALMEELERSFADANRGGYYLSGAQHGPLLVREKPAYDCPMPSVNSIAALNYGALLAPSVAFTSIFTFFSAREIVRTHWTWVRCQS